MIELLLQAVAKLTQLRDAILATQTVTPTPISPVIATPKYDTPPVPLKYLWDTKENARHSLRVICDEEHLSIDQKNKMSAVIHCESNYNVNCIHPNVVNGKTVSSDFGICQINDYYHIGDGKDFPSVQYVMDNPEVVVRWMCRQVKAGKINLWVCASRGLYRAYSA